MSTLQVANIWFESTANNRLQYIGPNVIAVYSGSNNVMNVTSTSVNIPILRTSNIVFESTANNKIVYDVTSGITFNQGLNNITNFYAGPLNVMNVASGGVTIPTLQLPATGTTATSNSTALLKMSSANTQQNNYIGNCIRLNLSNAATDYHNTDIVYNYGPTTDAANTTFSIQQSNSVGGFVGFIMKSNFKDKDLQFYTNATLQLSIANTGAVGVSSNTLTLGTSTIAANGYTYLPNGLKMNWGTMIVNTTSNATFISAFTTNAYFVGVTPINSGTYSGANVPNVPVVNNTGAQIRSLSTTTANTCYFWAIGI